MISQPSRSAGHPSIVFLGLGEVTGGLLQYSHPTTTVVLCCTVLRELLLY